MGYSTDFSGSINIEPPLDAQEIEFINKFSESRRMERTKGPYFVDGSGYHGQNADDDIVDYNEPPYGQPGLWCQWVVSDDGTELIWNEVEKFYAADQWMAYLIKHFLKRNPIAKSELPFLKGHILDGAIEAQGEDISDRWLLCVTNNKVTRHAATYGKGRPVN